MSVFCPGHTYLATSIAFIVGRLSSKNGKELLGRLQGKLQIFFHKFARRIEVTVSALAVCSLKMNSLYLAISFARLGKMVPRW